LEWHAERGVLRATHSGETPSAVVIRLGG
jgi:hypothetical protein